MEKTKKVSWKLIAMITAFVVIAAVVLLLIFLPKNKTPNAVMECSVNPDVQFVLDTNNKVMQVNYLNEDAEVLLKDVKFEGKSAEDAAQMFVKLSTEAGFIEVSTSGTEVNITISAEDTNKIKDLKSKVTTKVNEYFGENGIIAGAVTTLKSDFNEAITKLGVSTSEIAGKTQKEVLELLNETSENVKDIAYSLQNGFMEFVNELKNSDAFKKIPTLEETINNINEQINKSGLPSETKKALTKQLNAAKDELNDLNKKLEQKIDEKIEELKTLSKQIYDNAKTILNQKINEAKQAIEDHKEYVKSHKEAVDAAIKAYQDSLAK